MPSKAPANSLVRWLFVRSLAAIYLTAFLSFWVQAMGLIGADGVLPVTSRLSALEAAGKGFLQAPTLFWLNSSDLMIHAVCAAGVLIAAALAFWRRSWRFSPALLAALWALYLSLVTAGGVFMRLAPDQLLLETGFLAIFLSPSGPDAIVTWVFRWFVFRLFLAAGLVKIASFDPSWRALSALPAHFETQYLPNFGSWFAYQLPHVLLVASCAAVLAIELAVPFLIPFRGRPRRIAFALFSGFQLLVLITGDFGFLNLLMIAVCLMIIEDEDLPQKLKRWISRVSAARAAPRRRGRAPGSLGAFAHRLKTGGIAAIALLGLAPIALSLNFVPRLANRILAPLAPFKIVNHYLFFPVIFPRRLEIAIEASSDGRSWHELAFREKPSSTSVFPFEPVPHMSRLDIAMWFLAHGIDDRKAFFDPLLKKLLEGSPSTLRLFDPRAVDALGGAPRAVRALLYEYRFSSPEELLHTGEWWQRRLRGDYVPAVERER